MQVIKEVYIISTGDIIRGRMAGTQRVLKIAKSLSAGGINTYLCSLKYINNDRITPKELFPGIWSLESEGNLVSDSVHLSAFLRTVNKFIKERFSDKIIYLYPTSFVLKDFIYFIYFRVLKGYKFFCDINELRSSNVFATTAPSNITSKFIFYLKSFYDLISYKLSEFQAFFYDGIVVISANLHKYFKRFNKNIIRVPILCDLSNIMAGPETFLHFDNKVFKICFAGTISCAKEGFNILFEALEKLNSDKNVELYLYGPLHDNDKFVLEKLMTVLKLNSKVFYVGNIDADELLNEFKKYHLLILPRPLNLQTKYGFSTKLSEYLVSGVPALVTDVSDNALYIKDKINGYIVPPGSPSKMADKILEIISNYNMNAGEIAENAKLTAVREFDYRLYTRTFSDFFFKD